MTKLLNTNYTLNVTLLLITMIIKKLKKIEGIETDEITDELINKFLPEIKKQLPELTKYCLDRDTEIHKCNSSCHHHLKNDNYDKDYIKIHNYFKSRKHLNSQHDDFNTSSCVPIRHVSKCTENLHCECFTDSEEQI